jgi:hypothetical protein
MDTIFNNYHCHWLWQDSLILWAFRALPSQRIL